MMFLAVFEMRKNSKAAFVRQQSRRPIPRRRQSIQRHRIPPPPTPLAVIAAGVIHVDFERFTGLPVCGHADNLYRTHVRQLRGTRDLRSSDKYLNGGQVQRYERANVGWSQVHRSSSYTTENHVEHVMFNARIDFDRTPRQCARV